MTGLSTHTLVDAYGRASEQIERLSGAISMGLYRQRYVPEKKQQIARLWRLCEKIEAVMKDRYGTSAGISPDRPLWCREMKEQGITSAPCCGSCHSDWEYSDPFVERLLDGRYATPCCTKQMDLEASGLLGDSY